MIIIPDTIIIVIIYSVLLVIVYLKPRLHVLFKALRKLVYVKPILCKRTKAVSKPIWLNHIRRWFETSLKWFRHVCKQLKRFKPLYKIQGIDAAEPAFQQTLSFADSEQV